ncbi:CinA family protein [Chitinispirillales bacterium ANBcel5]|uniref:CinA family protein n=1 Tax=Cellulosispirillum alkaliphilum TaxID=3039283 RepID=UPI002A52E5BF|nr:CinA family protein [Chitinispirillales bacterium ANBcel5]
MNTVEELAAILKEKKYRISTAESCTGGLIGARLTDFKGSSEFFTGGIIAYDNRVKVDILGVSPDVLNQVGAVSSEVVEAMATGASSVFKTHCAVSVSGIAGPGGGSEEKPVGLVYIGSLVNSDIKSREFHFTGTRKDIRYLAVNAALGMIREHILSLD